MTIFHSGEVRFSDLMTEERFKELLPHMPTRKITRCIPSKAELECMRSLLECEREEFSRATALSLWEEWQHGVIGSADELHELYSVKMTAFDQEHVLPEPVVVVEEIPYEYI